MREEVEINKLKKEFFDVCDRIYLNERAQLVRYANSKKVRETLTKDRLRKKELEQILGIGVDE